MPVPIAVTKSRISCDEIIRSKRAFSTLRILPRSGRMAWFLRSRPCWRNHRPNHLDDEELGQGRITFLAIGQLAREGAGVERAFAPGQFLGLAGGLADTCGIQAFEGDLFGSAGCSSRYSPSFSFTSASTNPLTSLFPSFVFVWPSNCGSCTLTLITP